MNGEKAQESSINAIGAFEFQQMEVLQIRPALVLDACAGLKKNLPCLGRIDT